MIRAGTGQFMGDTPYPAPDSPRSNARQLLGWILLVLGAAIFLLGVDDLRTVIPTLSWPTVPGEIIEAKLTEDYVGHVVTRTWNRPSKMWRFHATYRYQMAKSAFKGTRLDLLPAARRDQKADLARYRVGQPVTVHYDPADPTRSVLEAQISTYSVTALALGILSLTAGWRLSTKRRQRESLTA